MFMHNQGWLSGSATYRHAKGKISSKIKSSVPQRQTLSAYGLAIAPTIDIKRQHFPLHNLDAFAFDIIIEHSSSLISHAISSKFDICNAEIAQCDIASLADECSDIKICGKWHVCNPMLIINASTERNTSGSTWTSLLSILCRIRFSDTNWTHVNRRDMASSVRGRDLPSSRKDSKSRRHPVTQPELENVFLVYRQYHFRPVADCNEFFIMSAREDPLPCTCSQSVR